MKPLHRGVLLAVFFLSGFAGLAYEIVWIREFSFVLGNSVYTISTVLAAYMAGLAAGSHLAGKFGFLLATPLLGYAALEAATAVTGTSLFYLLHGVLKGLGPVGVLSPDTLIPFLQRFIVSSAVLVVPTAMMGATLPLLARHCDRGRDKAGTVVGGLYGANTLGAAAGCFVTGFFIIRLLGTEAATWLAAGLNVLAAGLAVPLARLDLPGPAAAVIAPVPADTAAGGPAPEGGATPTVPAASEPPAAEPAPAAEEAAPPAAPFDRNTGRFFLVVMALSGMTSMAYELLYFRFLSYFMGNRVYASSAMLTVFLLGIGAGAAIAGRLLDRFRREVLVFSLMQVIIGVAAALTAAWFPGILDFIRYWEDELHPGAPWQFVLLRLLEAAAILGIPALAFGAMFPCAIRYLARGPMGLGRAAGTVYAVNTTGCILGSLGTGFVVIPALGSHNGMALTAALSMALAYRLVVTDRITLPGVRAIMAGAVGLVALLAGLWTSSTGKYPWPRPGLTCIFAREEPSALITAYKGPAGFYLWGDDTELSFPIGPMTNAVLVQRLQAQIPILLHPDPKRVLVIGMGFGITTGAFAAYGGLESVETVELFEGVIQASPLFGKYNDNPAANRRAKLIAGDGRYYLKHAPHGYDIIASNVTGPDLPGSAACYTKEYFELVKSRLNPGGLFLLHVFGRDRDVIFRTLDTVFPHVVGFRAYNQSVHLVASANPVRFDRRGGDRRLLASPPFRANAKTCGIWSFEDLMKRFVLSERDFRAIARAPRLPVNTDTHPILEYRFSGAGGDPFYARFSSRAPSPERTAMVTACGDVLLYHDATIDFFRYLTDTHIEDYDYVYKYVFKRIRGQFRGVVFANLESPLTDEAFEVKSDKGTALYFSAPPAYAKALAEGELHVLSLANDHIRDCGDRGVLWTLDTLAFAGLTGVGAGANMAEARRHQVVIENGLRLAFLAYDLVPPISARAGRDRPGAAWAGRAGIVLDVRRAREESDAVFVALHWGSDRTGKTPSFEPSASQRDLGRAIIDAGASAVFGSGSHTVRRAERYRHGLICYDLGDLMHADTPWKGHRRGLIIRTAVDGTGHVVRTSLIPVGIDPAGTEFRPAPLEGRERNALLARFGRL